MTPSLSMYNMNSNYGWQGLLQQGIYMLGGNYSNANFVFGNNGCFGGSGIFTNCYGEVDYDAMAGYGVASAVLGVAGQAVAANKANKAAEVNYTQELKKVQEEISTKQDKITKLGTSNTEENQNITTAQNTITTLNAELSRAKTTLETAEKAFSAAEKGDVNYLTLKREYEEAKENYEKTIPQKIKAEEDKIKAAQDKIKENDKQISDISDEKAELEKKQNEYQKAIDTATIKDSKSVSWKRADKSCIQDWQNKTKEKKATEKEMNRASYEYRHADNDKKKKECAKALINMYDSNPDGLKKYECLYEAVKREQNIEQS